MSFKSDTRDLSPIGIRELKPDERIIFGRFKIIRKLGAGSFGHVYYAEDTDTGQKVAVKLESERNGGNTQLPNENIVYQELTNEPGFPKCITYYCDTNGEIFLVMDVLYKNLKQLHEVCDRKFSVKTVLYIAMQTLSRIETIHRHNYVYRDIKPENFMIGIPGTDRVKIIHLVDFGLAKKYIDASTKEHIVMRENRPMTGTTRYMSCNAHQRRELSRRDDLESLGYLYLYLLKGSLPWSGSLPCKNAREMSLKVGSMKQSFSPEQLFDGFPSEFAEFLQYARGLEFEQTPDYETLHNKFMGVFAKLNLQDDGIFDWDHLLPN